MEKIKFKEKSKKAQGRYRFRSYPADQSVSVAERRRRILAGEISPNKISEWHENLIVSGEGYGLNLICRRLSGDKTIPIEIEELQVGSGDTAVTDGDTGLETAVATGIIRANQSVSGPQVTLTFFVSDLELPNGTYKELGIFCGNSDDRRLFARSIIFPNYTKAAAEDTTVEYIIEFNPI